MADVKISALPTGTTFDTADFLSGVDTSATATKKFSPAVILAGLLGSTSGLLKANGSGVLSAAVAGTDYLTPSGSGASLTGITAVQVGAEPTITAGTTAQYLRGDKSLATLNQAAVAGLKTSDSPVFTGLTVGSLSGLIKATAGVLSAATAGTDYLTTSYAGTTSLVTLGTVTTGTWSASTIAINKGGTGQTTAALAINALVPTQTGNGGKVLGTDGSVVSWVSSGGTGTVTQVSVVSANGFAGSVATDTTTPAITISTSVTGIVKGNGTALSAATLGTDYSKLLVPTAVKTTTYTAAAWDFVPCDSTSGGFTVTLPTAPADRTLVGVKHTTQGSTNVITVACGGSDTINRLAGPTTMALASLGRGAQFQYQSSTGIWYVITRDMGSMLAADVPAPGSDGQFLRNSSGVTTGSTRLIAGTGNSINLVPTSDPGSPVAGDLWHSSGQSALSYLNAGMVTRGGGNIYQALSAGTPVVNTTTQTSLFSGVSTSVGSLTFPANSLKAGTILRPTFFGMCTNAGTTTINFTILMGGTTIVNITSAALTATSGSTNIWILLPMTQLHIQSVGASGSVIGIFMTYVGFGTSIGTIGGGTGSGGSQWIVPTAVTLDTTASLTFDLQAKWSVANATNKIQLFGGGLFIDG